MLAELRRETLTPDVVQAYLEEYRADPTRCACRLGRNRDRIHRRIAEGERKVERLGGAIADHCAEFIALRTALANAHGVLLEAEKHRESQDAPQAVTVSRP